MSRSVASALICLLLAGCASEQISLLDQELQYYRYEQEKYRGADLESLYREEAERSEQLTREILAVRKEIQAKEEELREIRLRIAEVEKAVADAKSRIDASPQPTPAQKPPVKPAKPPAK